MTARAAVAGVVAAALLLAACGVEGGDEAASPGASPTTEAGGTAPASTTTAPPLEGPTGSDPGECDDAAAIGEVVGTEVDGFPSEGSSFADEVEYRYDGCTYTSFGEVDIGFLEVARLEIDGQSDARLYDLLDANARAAVWRDGFEPIEDLGDDAYLDGSTVVVLTGDLMVFVGYEPEDLATLEAPTPAIELARAALESLELTLDPAPSCDDVEPLVAEQLGDVEDAITSSGFIGVNDVSITTAGCRVDLADGAEASIAVADAAPWKAWVEAKEGFSFRSTYEALEVGGRPAFDDGEQLVVDDRVVGAGHRPWVVDTGLWDGDPADGAALRLDVAEAVIDG